MRWKQVLAPLQDRTFAWNFAARFVSTLGSMMVMVALAFAVLEITDAATALGLVLAAHTIPMVVFLLFGGVIADRLPRTLIMTTSSLMFALTRAPSRFW